MNFQQFNRPGFRTQIYEARIGISAKQFWMMTRCFPFQYPNSPNLLTVISLRERWQPRPTETLTDNHQFY